MIAAVAIRPDRKLWWRSFAQRSSATVTLRGERLEATGVVADGVDRESALRAYVSRYPRSSRVVRDAAIVVFELR